MADEDTEITLGAGKLLGLFFMLAAVCGIFFAVGFSLGKTSAREQALQEHAATEARAAASVPELSSSKPASANPTSESTRQSASEEPKQPEPDLTFYKAVRQPGGDANLDAQPKDAGPTKPMESPTPSSAVATPQPAKSAVSETPGTASASRRATGPSAGTSVAPATSPGSSFVVQIAAVTHEEDAAALAGALRKKSYAASVVNNPSGRDKLYHVVVGPYATLQDAEAMKARLQGEGYSPIVKR